MAIAYGGPGRYIQRAGEIAHLASHTGPIGRNALLLIDPFFNDELNESLIRQFSDVSLMATAMKFSGECTQTEIDRVAKVLKLNKSTVIVGIGGGKTADTAKLAASIVDARVVIVPTIASTDAPCSAVAVRYSDDGVFEEAISLSRNPDLILVDTEIIVKAPVRFLVSGMGDALSTWFEARSNMESRSHNYIGTHFSATTAGLAIAKACYETLMANGIAAKIAASQNLCTNAVEKIIEANTLLSSIGFENCGCSAAHGIHDGLTTLHETHHLLHGEKVAFGTLCLLVIENRPIAELEQTLKFCRKLGLPTTMRDLGLATNKLEFATQIAETALRSGGLIYATPVDLSVQMVRDSIIALDAIASELDN